ncbi:hypothetical protein CYMTET_47489 [Cymbomonas tetramitiformis]|uniref:Uncharacterized protein n=1 Tax=Cymbomonas tetramitiformis TaxID=36881 RepID=A0AAE0BU03_9CHLO|nr:hypothetical protein CYMTET_47489 [Cymbomonas tetramitiformis]
MIRPEETDEILVTSFEYLAALLEFNLVTLKFQLNHYLYEGFKEQLRAYVWSKFMMEVEWADSFAPSKVTSDRLAELADIIRGLREFLQEVDRMLHKVSSGQSWCDLLPVDDAIYE